MSLATAEKNSTDSLQKQDSVFSLLIQSQSVSRLKSIHIGPRPSGEIELKVMLRITQDYRWHWISDTFNSASEVWIVADTLIDNHVHQHPEDEEEMNAWRKELENMKAYEDSGVSVFYGMVA